jgi:hypothetical protein
LATVGTADVADDVMHIWVTKLLISPPWGVVRYTDGAAAEAITVSETSQGAELYAIRAAYQSSALVETDDWDTLDAVTGNALRAHRLANGEAGAARILEVTRNAIRSWRRLGGLSVASNSPIPVAGVRRRKVVAA